MTSSSLTPGGNRSVGEIVAATAVVVAVAGGFYLVYRFRVVVFLVLAAFILNVAITPAVNWLIRRGRSRSMAVALLYLALLLAISLFLILLGPLLVNQGADFAAKIPEYYQTARTALVGSPNYLLTRIGMIVPALPDLSPASVAAPDTETLVKVADFLENGASVLRVLLAGATIFALAYYWNLEGNRVELWMLHFVPLDRRERIRSIVDEIEQTVGAFLGGQLLLGLVIGVASLVAYLVIGLPNAVALAVLAGFFELVPLVGPLLSAAAALLVALAHDPSKAIWVVVSAVVIQALENYLLVPRVVGQSVGVNPLVTLLALAAFGSLFGIPGALLAIPLAAMVQIVLHNVVFDLDKQSGSATNGARNRAALLGYEARELVYDVRKTLRRKQELSTEASDRIEEMVEGIALDVERMLAELGQENLPSQIKELVAAAAVGAASS